MRLFHLHHNLSLTRAIHSSFRQFEMSIWLHVFARSLVSVFIPIFLVQIGYTLGEVMLYYFVFILFDVPLNFFTGWLVQRIGARWVIVLGQLAMIAYFLGLYSLGVGQWGMLLLIALCAALYDTLFWVGHLYYFMRCSQDQDDMGRDTSSLFMVRKIAAMAAPALGAVILIIGNRHALLGVSICFIVASLVPLFRIGSRVIDRPQRPILRWREFFRGWRDIKDYLSTAFYGIHDTSESVLWPLFIYSLFGNIESVAALPIIIASSTVLFSFFIGRSRKSRRPWLIGIGGLLVALVWILRLLVAHTVFYYGSVFLVGLFSVLISIPLDSSIFERGEKHDQLSAALYRNLFSMAPRLVLFGILAMLVNVFNVSFGIAALAMFMLMLINTLFQKRNLTSVISV